MGRMSDARKRARSKGGEAAGPEEARGGVPPAPDPEPPAPGAEPEQWLSRDEPLVFPADPPASGPKTRIALPSSGLAEDILARADAATIETLPIPEAAPPTPTPTPSESPRTHNVSFFASPVREERKTVESTEHLATFLLAGEEYGVDVRLVQEIIRVTEITPVPRAPEFIKGVINLRGRIIPVVDLKRKLSLGDVEASRLARIVVVKMKDRLIGLLVDGASQVLKVPLSTIEPAPEEVVEIDAHYIRGVAKLPDRLVILMDLQRILAPELREGVDVGPA
jgi:purine-binding chemotaxis protein CheW